MDWSTATLRTTVVLLGSSVLLIVPGTVGIGGSPLLAVAFAVLAGALYAVGDDLADLPAVAGHDLGTYGAVMWAAPVVATGVTALGLDASAAELQALGGLVGLVGMANYFLRPVYYAGISLARYVARAAK